MSYRFVLIPLLFSNACAAGNSFVCPDSVRISSATITLESAPAGFDVFVPKSLVRLSGFNVYDGPPEQGAELKPHSTTSRNAVWKFEGGYPQGVFLSCDYNNGAVRLTTRADGAVTSCSAKTEVVKPHQSLKVKFVCK